MFIPPIGHSKRIEARTAVREWLMQYRHKFELSVTLNFNRSITWNAAHDKVGEWAQRVDHTYLGRSYKKHPDHRLYFVAFFENADTNPHFHVLVRLPLVPWRRLRKSRFHNYRKSSWHGKVMEEHWVKIMKQGSCDTKKIYDLNGIVRYDTKQLSRPSADQQYVISTEFHPSPKQPYGGKGSV